MEHLSQKNYITLAIVAILLVSTMIVIYNIKKYNDVHISSCYFSHKIHYAKLHV